MKRSIYVLNWFIASYISFPQERDAVFFDGKQIAKILEDYELLKRIGRLEVAMINI